MKVGIVGLGLIGGSVARAYKANSDAVVLADDLDKVMLDFAEMSGDIDGRLEGAAGQCDVIILAIPPEAAIAYL